MEQGKMIISTHKKYSKSAKRSIGGIYIKSGKVSLYKFRIGRNSDV